MDLGDLADVGSPPHHGPAVQVRGLEVAFGTHRALAGIDLTVPDGAVVALLGPNGAGKTTTVRVLTTLLRPTAGTARVAGLDVVRDAARVRGLIAVTGQETSLDGRLTGREMLRMMARLRRLPRVAGRARVEEVLEAFDLADAAGRRIGTWSGGMQRRLDIAAGLLVRPRVLFLDEPTTGLDPRARRSVWDLVGSVAARGTTVVLTTQYLEEAEQLADEIVVVDAGRVVARGTAGALKRRVGGATVEVEVRGEAVPRRYATDGTVGDARRILAHLEDTAIPVERWSLREPTLDDVFLALTGVPSGGGTSARRAPSAARTEER
nr:ATP-binding cassette domain-containing protein [uncultured Actinotalea sp.]